MKETLDIAIRWCILVLLIVSMLYIVFDSKKDIKEKSELRQLQMEYYRTATKRDSVIIQRELKFLNK